MTSTVRSRAETVAMLLRVGVIPVVRCDAADVAVRVAEALFGAGLPIVEVTMTVPGAIDAIAKLARRRRLEKTDRVLVGTGTVTDAASARDAIAAGLICGRLRGAEWETAAGYGVALASLKHQTPGDFSRASLEDVERVLKGAVPTETR